jgi:hypothetical protein
MNVVYIDATGNEGVKQVVNDIEKRLKREKVDRVGRILGRIAAAAFIVVPTGYVLLKTKQGIDAAEKESDAKA